MLSARRRVLKSEGNLNSEIGLPMTVLNGLTHRPPHEIAVLEMAMYQLGDIRLLARLARPRIGVVTAVLPVHLERLGTIERIQQAKQELVEELPSDGVAVLNADDPRVAEMATATAARVVRYGVSENADVRAEHIESDGLRGVEFDLLHAGKRRHVHLPLLGAHSVHAALAATAVALEEGFSLSRGRRGAAGAVADAALAGASTAINGSRIVDDSYNASPESVLAALNLLRELPGRRKIAVLGDMLELGSEEESEPPARRQPRGGGARPADRLRAALEDHRRRGQARRAATPTRSSRPRPSTRSSSCLRRALRPGDDVLVKGSLAMGMSAVVRGIRAEGEG